LDVNKEKRYLYHLLPLLNTHLMMQVLGLSRHFLKMERVRESHRTQFNYFKDRKKKKAEAGIEPYTAVRKEQQIHQI